MVAPPRSWCSVRRRSCVLARARREEWRHNGRAAATYLAILHYATTFTPARRRARLIALWRNPGRSAASTHYHMGNRFAFAIFCQHSPMALLVGTNFINISPSGTGGKVSPA